MMVNYTCILTAPNDVQGRAYIRWREMELKAAGVEYKVAKSMTKVTLKWEMGMEVQGK